MYSEDCYTPKENNVRPVYDSEAQGITKTMAAMPKIYGCIL